MAKKSKVKEYVDPVKDLRSRMFLALQPVLKLLEEGERKNIAVGFSFSKGVFGKTLIDLRVNKN